PQSSLQKLEKLPPNTTLDIPRPGQTSIPGPDRSRLLLREVLYSVERHYPLLDAALQQRDIATGQTMSALGDFDFKVGGSSYGQQGSYDSNRYELGFVQPFAYQGISVSGRYRKSAGNFPSYYGRRFTGEGGEFGLNFTVPLMRDREIDGRRAKVRSAELGQDLAEPGIAEKRIGFLRAASTAYWRWLASARRYQIAKQLLEIAEKRDDYLRKREQQGAVAKIEVIDNRRTIVDRRAKLVSFQRRYEQASIDLSLFLRDPSGKPVRPEALYLAPDFPDPVIPDVEKIDQDVDLALGQRPELTTLRLQRQRLQVDLRLAENQTLPGLFLDLTAEQDIGQGSSTLDRNTYYAGVILDVPLQRRQAKGKILSTQASVAQINAQERFARDQISAQVQDVISALTRAYEVRVRAGQNVELARVMEQAEVRKLELGQSNILFVNLRELARADAQLQEVDALTEYFLSLADYYAILGLGGPPEFSPANPNQKR
ncbi:MAG: TolC family protein, partial [Bdellovibrionales bacterium]